MFNELGSAVVQNVKFRDVWAFVSQKGIRGFTEFEQVGTLDPEIVISMPQIVLSGPEDKLNVWLPQM